MVVRGEALGIFSIDNLQRDKYFQVSLTIRKMSDITKFILKTWGLQGYTQNIHCGYWLELLGRAVLMCTHNVCFEQNY